MKAVFGGVPANDSTRDYGFMHRKTTGAIWDMVTGYKGTADLSIALERGEIDGFCGFDWASLKSQRPDWVRDKVVNVLIQDAIEPNDELTKLGVPHIMKYVKDDTTRKVLELILSQTVFHRSFIAPPEHRAGATRHPAQGVRRHHEGPAVPGRCREAAHRRGAAVGRAGAGGRAQSLSHRRRRSIDLARAAINP